MSKTVSLTPSHRTKQYLVATVLVCSVVVPALGAGLAAAGLPMGAALGLAAVVALGVATLWVRRLGGAEKESTWGGIPGWQYGGRLVESGGLARQEQEEALERAGDEE